MSASNEGGGESGRLREDPLVAALVPDPSTGPPDTTVLHGYVGKSTSANYWRLYLDLTLTSYVEVLESDVLHHRQVRDDGGVLVWVPKSLELKVTRVSSTSVQAEFLSGAIASGRMQPTQRANVVSRAVAPRAVAYPSIFNNCTSILLSCPSDGCPSWGYCPTEMTLCAPSEFAPLCTVVGFP